MDHSSQKCNEKEASWVMVDPIDLAEEAVEWDTSPQPQKPEPSESDFESDGISVISESSHLHDEEHSHASENSEEGQIRKEIHTSEDMVTWTFVNSELTRLESPLPESSSKQFYLNCLQEPVQELSEHELGSIQSDAESDSISIISECESLDENKFPVELRRLSEDNTKFQIVSKTPPSAGIHKYFNGLMIGTILLASGSIFLGQYLNIADLIGDIKAGHDLSNEYNVPTLLTFCKNKHKADGINTENNIDKCLGKIEKSMQKKKLELKKYDYVKNMDKHLKIKEQYLGEKEKFLIKKEYELLKVEMKLKKQQLKKYRKAKTQKKGAAEAPKIDKGGSDNSLKTTGGSGVSEKHFQAKKKLVWKDTSKSDNNVLKKTELPCIKCSKHNKKSEKASDKSKFEIERKKGEKVRNRASKFQTKTTERSEEENYETGTNYVILQNGSNATISGYWVGKLYKARSDLRNKEHLGDWYFDRASYRKKKRDKGSWYFDWMMDREMLRYKRFQNI